MQEKIKALKEKGWFDKYLCRLSLLDHIHECLEKDNYLKAIDAPKDSAGYKNLDKELMDLKIILDFYFDGKEQLYQKRIDKFLEKLEKEK